MFQMLTKSGREAARQAKVRRADELALTQARLARNAAQSRTGAVLGELWRLSSKYGQITEGEPFACSRCVEGTVPADMRDMHRCEGTVQLVHITGSTLVLARRQLRVHRATRASDTVCYQLLIGDVVVASCQEPRSRRSDDWHREEYGKWLGAARGWTTPRWAERLAHSEEAIVALSDDALIVQGFITELRVEEQAARARAARARAARELDERAGLFAAAPTWQQAADRLAI